MLSTFDLAGHVIGVILDKDMTKEAVQEIIDKIEEKLLIYDTINVFVEIEKDRKISIIGLLNGIKFKYQNSSKLDKFAVVTDSRWFKKAIHISDVFLDVDVRTFDIKDRLEAIQWISQ